MENFSRINDIPIIVRRYQAYTDRFKSRVWRILVKRDDRKQVDENGASSCHVIALGWTWKEREEVVHSNVSIRWPDHTLFLPFSRK